MQTVEQFFQEIREDDNFSDSFNEMIQLAESDQQADVNFLAKNYYQYWIMLRFIKDEALDDHLFMSAFIQLLVFFFFLFLYA